MVREEVVVQEVMLFLLEEQKGSRNRLRGRFRRTGWRMCC